MATQDLDTLNPPREESAAETERKNFFALETFAGCPHCGCPVDVRAAAARMCRELAQTVFDRLNDGARPIELLHPLELVVFDCMEKEREAMIGTLPLRLLFQS